METTIGIVKCSDYEPEDVEKSVRMCFELLDGAAKVIKPGMKVLLKPNLLVGSPPERAINTHPEIVRAVIRWLKDKGAKAVVGDNPAFTRLQPTMKKAGILDVINEEETDIANFSETFYLYNKNGKHFQRFEISKAFDEADAIINLPKFKTHGITYITGALKNLFGAIPGLEKSKWHLRAQSKDEFASLLVDLYGAFVVGFTPPKPILHLMDAVLCQEGEGPGTGGTPRKIGALMIGTDAAAMDVVAARLAGLDTAKVKTSIFAQQCALGTADFSRIHIVGDRLEEFQVKKFKPSRSSFTSNMMKWPLTTPFVRNQIVERPYITKEKCSKCLSCVKICQSGAVFQRDKDDRVPVFDYDRCIRCYCCQEVCPEAAIELRHSRLGRLFNLFSAS
ncbi:MAG: DUF362 domain-containing protein [bacterium]